MEIDRAVVTSEKATGHRNRAIAYLERNAGMIDERIDEHLDLYFEQCSALVSAKDLAVMAATLANNGLNPLTGERALEESYVKNVLSVMHSCGMYDYAGEWGYRIGLRGQERSRRGHYRGSSRTVRHWNVFAVARPSREQLPGHQGL